MFNDEYDDEEEVDLKPKKNNVKPLAMPMAAPKPPPMM